MTKSRTLADLTIPSGTPVGTTDTQTLTNKTLTAPTIASANLTTALTVAGAAGTSGQVLTSAGSGAAPTWSNVTTSPAGSTGQVQYNNAGAFGAVSSGTSGQVLTSAGSGAAPTWSTPSSGAMVYISTTTASSSATIDITGLSSAYSQYVIIATGVKPDSNNVRMSCRFQYNGSWLTTSYSYSFVTANGAGGNNGDTSEIWLVGNSLGAGSGAYFTVNFPNPSATSINKSIYWAGAYTMADNSTSYQMTGGGTQWNSTALAVTGIRFFTNSGNITTGTFRLYGIVGS